MMRYTGYQEEKQTLKIKVRAAIAKRLQAIRVYHLPRQVCSVAAISTEVKMLISLGQHRKDQ